MPGQTVKIMDPAEMRRGGGAQFEVELRGNLALADLDAAANEFMATAADEAAASSTSTRA